MPQADTPSILVAFKKSRWEHYTEGSPEGEGLSDGSRPVDTEELEEAHRIHRRAVEAVCDHLQAGGWDFEAHYRGDVEKTDQYDLIITIGGDGTVLDLSHRVTDVPILGVNSHPGSSVGYFCAGIVDEFDELLADALSGAMETFSLARFQVEVNGEPTGPPVLNDFLLAHENPAAVSRYVLTVGEGPSESLRSSGLWVATPAGSTAAIRSAGGMVLPLAARSLEYLVREPYPIPERPYRYHKGVQPMNATFRIESKMEYGRLFIDGPHLAYRLRFGDVVRIDHRAPPLKIFGLDIERRTHPE
jgi:NAD+ kinase